MRRHVNRDGHDEDAGMQREGLGLGGIHAANGGREDSKGGSDHALRRRVGALRLRVDSYLGLCYGAFGPS